MAIDQDALATLVAKDEIRDLAMLYSRGVDRKDIALLRSLYAPDATDNHGNVYNGPVDGYLAFLERAVPHMHYSGHHICNHLVSVEGDRGEGEVYAIAWHIVPDGKGGMMEDIQCVRYIDKYRKEDGRWLFADRVVTFDNRSQRPVPTPAEPMADPIADPSVTWLTQRLFARGERA